MQRLASAQSLIVRQKKELGEILTGFEQRNKYMVTDPAGSDLYAAVESGGSTLARVILRNIRPFEMQVIDLQRRTVLQLRRPFRWFFHEMWIADAAQRSIGSIRREFSFLRRVYSVREASGREIYRLYGPLLHPWTFEVRKGNNDSVVGRIVKKWSGLARETLTDADTFGVTFPAGAAVAEKALLLAAVFLIDFVHFENNSD